MEDKITDEKLDHYHDVTKRALAKVKIPGTLSAKEKAWAEDYLDMATRYFSDSEYFRKKGDYVNAFGCLNYAHGWLDAGARIGLFDVDHDSTLFTVD